MKEILVVGSLNMDLVFSVDHQPLMGETVLSSGFSMNPGGKGANQAYAAGRLGGCVKMIGCVGDDIYGESLINNLQSAGVDTGAVARLDDVSTGIAGITVTSSGDNAIIVASGANFYLTPEMIRHNEDLIRAADYVLTQLETPVETVLTLAEMVKKAGKVMVLDPAPARADLPDELFPLVDVLKPNETELQSLTGLPVDTDTHIAQAARTLLAKGVKMVVVTMGERGAMIVTKEDTLFVPALLVKPVDTTAAGDTFTAAMVCGLADGMGLEDAVRFANKVSSIVVTRKGAQMSIPDMSEIEL